jgi:predicted O-linked N-acetylglucosamine transferase (SPINDLY family)
LLATYRQHLVLQRQALPLFDAPRYTRELESLFGRMVGRWRAGLPCEHLLAEAG